MWHRLVLVSVSLIGISVMAQRAWSLERTTRANATESICCEIHESYVTYSGFDPRTRCVSDGGSVVGDKKCTGPTSF